MGPVCSRKIHWNTGIAIVVGTSSICVDMVRSMPNTVATGTNVEHRTGSVVLDLRHGTCGEMEVRLRSLSLWRQHWAWRTSLKETH